MSQSTARLAWPGQDPIGKRLRWATDEERGRWRTVVGVVGDSRYRNFLNPRATVYVPAAQQPWGAGYVLVRTSTPFVAMVPALRQIAREIHPDLDLVNAAPMARVLDQPLARPRFNAGVLLLFSLAAVTLTAVGLYGLTAFVVAQRRREVGIRMALGAEARQIIGLFLRRGMFPVFAGAALGLGVALATRRVMASLVYGVATTDAAALAGAVVGFVLIALAAILTASRSAARTDPMVVLRAE